MTEVPIAAEYHLRPARPQDARLFWEWANDPTVRASSFNGQPISWESHERWFSARLQSPDTRIWILEVGGVPVGQIRYNRDGQGTSAEISYSVAREHRGRGFGGLLITTTRESALAELDVEEITAVALVENSVSHGAFTGAGFTQHGPERVQDRDCYRFCWRPQQRPLRSVLNGDGS